MINECIVPLMVQRDATCDICRKIAIIITTKKSFLWLYLSVCFSITSELFATHN